VETPNAGLFSFGAFHNLFTHFGLHAAFVLDHIAITTAAKSIAELMRIYNSLRPHIPVWVTQLSELATIVTRPEITAGAREMVRLGVALTIRRLVREAASSVFSCLFPGVGALISSAHAGATRRPTEQETLVLELCTPHDITLCISQALQEYPLERAVLITHLCFFLALTIGASEIADAKHQRRYESLEGNAHLFAPAFVMMVDLAKSGRVVLDPGNEAAGISEFYRIAAHLLELQPNTENKYTLIILMDMIAHQLKVLEYGWLSKVFPVALITQASIALYGETVKRKEETVAVLAKPTTSKERMTE
jgi:hypothetical protein